MVKTGPLALALTLLLAGCASTLSSGEPDRSAVAALVRDADELTGAGRTLAESAHGVRDGDFCAKRAPAQLGRVRFRLLLRKFRHHAAKRLRKIIKKFIKRRRSGAHPMISADT